MADNPFFTSGGGSFGPGLGALAQAFVPDPARTASRVHDQAAAQHEAAKTRELGAQREATDAMAKRIATGGATPEVLNGILSDAVRTRDPAIVGHAHDLLRMYGFIQPGTTQPQRDRFYMGAGGAAQHTETGAASQEATKRADFGSRDATSRANTATRDATDRYQINENIAQKDRHFTVNVAPGHDVYLPPGSPVRGEPVQPAPISGGTRERNDAAGAAINDVVNNPNLTPAEQQQRLAEISAARSPAQQRPGGYRAQTASGWDRGLAPPSGVVNPNVAGAPTVLRGQPTRDTATAAQIPAFVNPPAGEAPAVTENRQQLVAPRAASAEIAAAAKPGGANDRPLSAATSKLLDTYVAVPIRVGDVDYAVDPAARAQIRTRAEQLYKSGDPGIRGVPGAAVEAAQAEFLAARPPRVDSWYNSTKTYGALPRGLGSAEAPATPDAPAGIPPGTPSATGPNGQKVYLLNGKWVPGPGA